MSISEVQQKVQDFPDKPGVYLMKNATRKIIYVGKAKSIRKRVRSYFKGMKDIKTRILMENVTDIETILTSNEYEALLLENTLIKQWKPRFNINLKDGKSYPVIRITLERFPRIFRTRRILFDGSTYFGPFPNAGQLDLYLNLIERLFPLRKCKGKLKKRSHPCLYYHIGRCSAPCCDLIDHAEYQSHVEKIKKLLSGQTDELIRELRERMNESSKNLDFERAAVHRDRIRTIEEFSESQQVMDGNTEARDYIGYAGEDNLASFAILKMRAGALVGKELFRTEIYSDTEEALTQFTIQYYTKTHNPPDTLHIQASDGTESLASYLEEILGKKIAVVSMPEKSHKKILEMATLNAREDLLARNRERKHQQILEELKRTLRLKRLPRRIEGFDIAHLGGKDTVASMVSFLNGKPDKASYRHYKLRTLRGRIDDYEAMREIVARRYSRVLNENIEKPDLILVDGGKGQVSAALSVLESLGLETIPLAGLAKENEAIYLPHSGEPVILEEGSEALRILQAVRNESHRFATTFHKKLREKHLTVSLLEGVRGIGRRRSQKLIKTFGSLEEILNCSPEDLIKTVGITRDTAQDLIEFLKRREAERERGENPPPPTALSTET